MDKPVRETQVGTPPTGEARAGSVVVGYDDSEGARLGLQWAATQAAAEGRTLTLLLSTSQSALRTAFRLQLDDRDQADVLERLRVADLAVLKQAARHVVDTHPGLEVEVVLVDTDARTALVEASHRAHLVVVGSRGRGVVASLLLGSVSRYVAEHASCPVVVVRQGPEQAGKGVLVGVDWSPTSTAVAEFAFRQASLRGVPLTVMHAMWNVPVALADRPLTQVDDRAGLGQMLSEAIAGLREKYPDVPVLFELRRGLADECLTRAAPRTDLVVVGRPQHDLLTRVLDGSTALALVEHARGVVAVVPESSAG